MTRDRFTPRVDVDLTGIVAEHLADWTPPQWDDPHDAQQTADELNRMLDITDTDDAYTAATIIDWRREFAPADDNEARRRAAGSILFDVRDVVNLPGPRSIYRSRWLHRLASLLYVAGITRTGGSARTGGHDPVGGWIYDLPQWRDVLPRRGQMRPYMLGKPSEWWDCQRTQGLSLRRHRPGPFVWGICGTCHPWPCCGAIGLTHTRECSDA